MTERQQLLALAGLLYVGECVRWVRRGSVVLAAAPDRRAWRRSPLLHNERGDAYVGWPLPPFGEFLVVRGTPFSAGEPGVVTATTSSLHANGHPSQAARLWTWESLAKARSSGDRVVVGTDRVWRGDTPFEAAQVAAWLVRMAGLPASERRAALERHVADSFDAAAVRTRLDEWKSALQPLRLAQSTLFAWLFAVLPAAVWWWGWFPTLGWAVPPVFLGSVWIARRFARLAREWHPEEKDERARLALLLALSPLTALRASDIAGRSRLAWFHPAAVAAVFLDVAAAEAFAAGLFRDLNCPRQPLPTADPAMMAILEAERTRVLATMTAWARKQGWNPDAWTHPPSPTDPGHVKFCPRCHGQFTAQATECGECGGVRLGGMGSPGSGGGAR